MSRFYRSTREAFPVERFPAVFGPYSRPNGEKVLGAVLVIVGAIALAALIFHQLSK